MPSTKPEKARIINLDNPGEEPVDCLFNPNEYTFSKRNSWNKSEVKGLDAPPLEFGGGDSMTLKMQLFFDTYETGEDVRDTTNRIWKLMNISEKLTATRNMLDAECSTFDISCHTGYLALRHTPQSPHHSFRAVSTGMG